MTAGSDCDCLVCRMEASLLDELSHEKGLGEYRLWARSSQVLARFPTAAQLIAHLHQQSDGQNFAVDDVIVELVRAGTNRPPDSLWQSLLLLVFIPTVHRTTTQVTAAFPMLGREDTAQHLFATLLELLHSRELRSRRSHVAFAVARRLRRSAFRWAIRESRLDLPKDWDAAAARSEASEAGGDESAAGVLLAEFLDNCQRQGWLAEEERQLLVQIKLEGITSPELARRSGHSVAAIQQRVHRLLVRLRRVTQESGGGTPEQLDLFRR